MSQNAKQTDEQLIDELLDDIASENFNEWEKSFAQSMSEKRDKYRGDVRLSDKQRAAVVKILGKYAGGSGE